MLNENSVDALRDEWADLADRADAPPWLRPDWIASWWHAFGRGKLHVLASRRNGTLDGILPVYRHLGHVSATANTETPGFGMIAGSNEAIPELQQQLFALRGHRITLFPMHDHEIDRDLWPEAAQRAGYTIVQRLLRRSPYIDLDQGWEDYEARLGRKFRAEVRRRMRRLEEEAPVEFSEDHGEDLEAGLEEIFRLEQKSWKGKRKTAIASRKDATVFYRSIAAAERERGTLRIERLHLGGRMIAFDLSLEERGRHYLLKTSFDDDLAPFAPGTLLRHHVLKQCFERGLSRYELLGRAEPWKLRWTSDAYELRLFRAFSPTVAGKAAGNAEQRLRPMIQRARGKKGKSST